MTTPACISTSAAPTRRGAGPRADTGSVTLEVAILMPALLLTLALVFVLARYSAAATNVDTAAASAARAASLARSSATAHEQAQQAAAAQLAQQGIDCAPLDTDVDTAGFAAPLGTDAAVHVQLSCDVPLSNLGFPGAGSRQISAAGDSPIDPYRARSSS